MIALQYREFGNPAQVIAPENLDIPKPGPGQARLRLVRSPIHNHDLATIRGVYGVKPPLPAVGGSEMLGIVDAVAGESAIGPGTRVVCTIQGAWSEYALAPLAALVPVPEAIEDDVAAQLLAMPLSALMLLDNLGAGAGDWIVQNAANGAVGRLLVREAERRAINVVSLVRSEDTARRLREFGAPHVVVTEGDWVARVRQAAGGAPISRAVDSVGGAQTLQLQRLLAERGELIVFGGLAAQPLQLDPSLMISRELVVRGFWMSSLMRRPENWERIQAAMKRVFELAQRHELELATAGVHRLSDARNALLRAESPGRTGKILFSP